MHRLVADGVTDALLENDGLSGAAVDLEVEDRAGIAKRITQDACVDLE